MSTMYFLAVKDSEYAEITFDLDAVINDFPLPDKNDAADQITAIHRFVFSNFELLQRVASELANFDHRTLSDNGYKILGAVANAGRLVRQNETQDLMLYLSISEKRFLVSDKEKGREIRDHFQRQKFSDPEWENYGSTGTA